VPPDRPRLWDSLKRALAGSPRADDPDPESPRPSAYAPPFLAPDEPPDVLPDREPPKSEPPAPAPERAAEGVETTVAAVPEDRPDPASAPRAPEPEGPRPARLARGLASFSRENADRGKKYRHILSDGESGKKKS
jgi:hypothetical protein